MIRVVLEFPGAYEAQDAVKNLLASGGTAAFTVAKKITDEVNRAETTINSKAYTNPVDNDDRHIHLLAITTLTGEQIPYVNHSPCIYVPCKLKGGTQAAIPLYACAVYGSKKEVADYLVDSLNKVHATINSVPKHAVNAFDLSAGVCLPFSTLQSYADSLGAPYKPSALTIDPAAQVTLGGQDQ